MTTERGPLADDLLDAIIVKLGLVYGKRFSQSYDTDPMLVRRHWAHELSGMSESGVRYALAHLPPDHPPNVLQFRAIGACRPQEDLKQLPAPQASASVRERARAALQSLRGTFTIDDQLQNHLAWAERILADPQAHSRAAVSNAMDALRSRGRL